MFRLLNLLLLFALTLFVMTAHARKYTTTVDGEEVVATVFTDADDDVITSVIDTIGVAEVTTTGTGTRTRSSVAPAVMSDTSTDTYFIPAPTKTAVLASHEPTRSGVRVTAATAVVPSGSIQAVGDMQTSRASAQESAASASAASGAGRRASLGPGAVAVAVAGAVALAAAL